MKIDEKDLAYLIDIYENCLDIISFTENITFYKFEQDIMRRKAVERSFEIIGQAANKINKETQIYLNDIPWSQIIGFRNKLAHDYGEILTVFVWNISKNHIPKLMKVLLKIDQLQSLIMNESNNE